MSLSGRANPAYSHGHCPKSTGQSSEYMTWSAMIQRCENPKNSAYADYGGRGIAVCERWKDFKNFIDDMGRRPAGFTLERKINSEGYCPTNCKWVPRRENNRNKRNNIWLTFDGVTMTAKDWSLHSSVSYYAFYHRIKRGWSLVKALTESSRTA